MRPVECAAAGLASFRDEEEIEAAAILKGVMDAVGFATVAN